MRERVARDRVDEHIPDALGEIVTSAVHDLERGVRDDARGGATYTGPTTVSTAPLTKLASSEARNR